MERFAGADVGTPKESPKWAVTGVEAVAVAARDGR